MKNLNKIKLTKKKLKALKKATYEILDTSKVEWHDDRFYKLTLPGNIDESFLQNIPENFLIRSEQSEGNISAYLPSVTTILGVQSKPFLIHWHGEIGNEKAAKIVSEALSKGSNIHEAINMLALGWSVIYKNPKFPNITDAEIKEYSAESETQAHIIYSQDEMLQLYRYKQVIDIIQPEILETEEPVYNLVECYGGTIDQVWNIKQDTEFTINSSRDTTTLKAGKYLVDFKTGKTFDEHDTKIQMSAYAHAHHLNIIGCLGIHLNSSNKTGLPGVKIYHYDKNNMDSGLDTFNALHKIFMARNSDTFPKNYEIPLIINLKITKQTNHEN